MTIAEKIQFSAENTRFTLFKEGLFFKCYNEDAMVFSKRVKNYKVISKFIKSVGSAVLSLGFPASEIEKGHLTLQSISEAIEASTYTEKHYGIVFSLKEDIKQNYQEFFEEIHKSNLNFNSSNANMNSNNRANGNSVRCLKDCNTLHGSTTALVSFSTNRKQFV